MLNWKSKLFNKSYFYRLVCSYVIMFLALFIIYVVGSSIIVNEAKKESEENSLRVLENSRDNIDHEILLINQLATLIGANSDVINAMSAEKTKGFVYADYEWIDYLKNIRATTDVIDEIYIYNNDRGRIVSSSTALSVEDYFATKHAYRDYTFAEWMRLLDETTRQRFIMLPKKSGAPNENYFAYIRPLSFGVDSEKPLTLVILVNIPRLTLGISKMEAGENSQLTIVDKNGASVMSIGNVTNVENLNEMETGLHKFGKTDYAVRSINSKVISWKYVSIIPQEPFISRQFFINLIAVIWTILYIICGIILIKVFSKSSYRPLEGLAKELKISKTTQYVDGELSAIKKSIENMNKEYEALLKSEQKNNIQQREKYLKDILEGGSAKTLFDEAMMKKYSFNLISDCFSVMLVQVVNLSVVAEKADVEAGMVQYALKNVISELIEERGGKCFTCTMQADLLAVVINHGGDKRDNRSLIEDAIRNFDKFFVGNYEIETFIAVSSEQKTVFAIETGYREAVQAKKYYLVEGERSVVFYDDIKDKSVDYAYTIDDEREITVALHSGDYARVEGVIRKLFIKNVYSKKYASIAVQSFIFELERTLMKTMPASVVMDIIADEGKTVMEIQSKLLDAIAEYCSAQKNHGQKSISTEVQDYICAHYADTGLSVNSLGEHFGLTPSYLSKLFKEQTNMSLLNYIHEVRIGHAEELIQKGVSITKATAQVGYISSNSFVRAYKKIRGVTPSSYKKK